MSQDQAITIAVIGDVHDQWETEDEHALNHLGVDLALFVGDFGNESLEVVGAIASLTIPKAVILGNHDAWYTASPWGRKKAPYDQTIEDRVQKQLDLLGEAHVGYGQRDFPELNLSVVGSRPFSWGGQEWKNEEFYRDRYGINNFTQSTEKIVAEAQKTAHDTIIFLGHNGPFGLGNAPEDPCGRDWNPLGGDFGDPDFADGMTQVRQNGKTIPLVTFGHMHHRLRHRKDRLRTQVCHSPQGTVYLNAASVPRIFEKEGAKLRNFSLVTLQSDTVLQIALVSVGEDFSIVSEEILYNSLANVPTV